MTSTKTNKDAYTEKTDERTEQNEEISVNTFMKDVNAEEIRDSIAFISCEVDHLKEGMTLRSLVKYDNR